VVSENVRVHQAVDGLKKGDGELVGRLFLESHASLRDDYEVSIPEVDLLVTLFSEEEGVFGARMTGGGFGGSVLALVEAGRAAEVTQRVKKFYEEKTGERATVLVPELK
jgi:galactokinase